MPHFFTGVKMSFVERLRALNLSDDTSVTVTYEDGCDVLHYTDDHIDLAVSETGICNVLAEAIAEGPLYRYGNEVLQEMRDDGLLEEYPRDGSGFVDYVAEVISKNYWDYSWLEHSTSRYDHKRGFTTFTLEFDIPFGQIKDDPYAFSGWTASVSTDNGTLVLD